MDEFDFGTDGADLSTSVMNFSFGAGGKITSLWASEGMGSFGADQQFVCGPIQIGDETSDEYLPGTILLGTRSDLDEPWIVSRNSGGDIRTIENGIEIDYEFSLQSDLDVKGKFFENPEMPGVVVWEIAITNKSRQSVEIGELGFPFALQTSLEGFPVSDEGMNSLLTERLVVQKYIGGSGSYLSARKVCGDPPGLLIFPGTDTSFEFCHSSPLSLRIAPGWPGIPIFYIHSQATIEREAWEEWFYGHSTLVMEPKERKVFRICFAPILARHGFDVPLALAEYGVPAFRPSPGAVVPMDVPMTVEILGTRPAQIAFDFEVEDNESESDEYGATTTFRSKQTGQNRLHVEGMNGREAFAHFFVTKPISEMAESRAAWICKHQVAKKGPIHHAIVPVDLTEGIALTDTFDSSWTIIGSLADATFLAEKLRIYFEPDQTKALDNYIEKFLLLKFHKPGQGTVGAITPQWEGSISVDASRAQLYVFAARLYLSCADLAATAKMSRTPEQYRELAHELVRGMLRFADREGYMAQALYGATELMQFPEWRSMREKFLDRFRLPFWSGRNYSYATVSEVAAIAEETGSMGGAGSVEQLSLTNKSFAPNWWSYGSEPRPCTDFDGHPFLPDYGEVYPSYTSVATSLAMTTWLNRDYMRLDEAGIRLANAGMLAPWCLVRMDGALSMGVCPDLGSSQRSIVKYTGDAGFALADYLRYATGYLLSSFERGFVGVGLHVETYDRGGEMVVRLEPWDGVGRRIVVRNLNLIVSVEGVKIDVLEFDVNLKWLKVALDNPTEAMKRKATIRVDGLWGTKFNAPGLEQRIEDGVLVLETTVDPGALKEIEVRVAK